MKFKGIITEAMIDNLQMNKFDKGILKMIHKQLNTEDYKEGSGNVNDFLFSLAKKAGVDMHEMTTLYMTYEKYKEFLFSEEGIEKVTEYDVMSPDLAKLTKEILLMYLEKNYENKTVFEFDGISGELNISEDIETMIEEDMNPDVWVTMRVVGEYEGTVPNSDETYVTEETSFQGSIFFNLLPDTIKGYGYDFLSFNEESFGDWLVANEGRQYSDVLDSGYIKSAYLKPPLNYSDTEIKGYCERWFMVIKRICGKSVPILNKYKDFVEHGGYMFEGYKIKRKTIK